MFGSQILEVAIGVAFVYVLISIVCTAVREGVEGALKTRGSYLVAGLKELFNVRDQQGVAFLQSFFGHPLISSLFPDQLPTLNTTRGPSAARSGGNLPSYIPSQNFALAIMDMAARAGAAEDQPGRQTLSLDSIKAGLKNLDNPCVEQMLGLAVDRAEGDMNKLQLILEDWFDATMQRVSGWYKRSTQKILFGVGLILAVGLNVNTITIADYLYRNSTERQAVIAKASAGASNRDPSTSATGSSQPDLQGQSDRAIAELSSMHLPIGWGQGYGAPIPDVVAKAEGLPSQNDAWNYFFGPILGWLLTALAATLGAPFWFDVLGRIMNVRSTFKPPTTGGSARPASTTLLPAFSPAVRTQHAPAQPVRDPALPAGASEDELDGCGIAVENPTADADLPAATGGVA